MSARLHGPDAIADKIVRDLRTPLAAILGFSRALLSAAADELSPQCAHFAQRIQSAAEQMDRTTEALSQFWWLAQTSVNRQLVDLAPMANGCIAALRAVNPGREVSCSVAPCMWADADPRLIRLALQAVLANAWKYTSHLARASVEVGIELRADKEMHYFVRDNGTGFGPPAAVHSPEVVQRLEGDGLAAMGIGLATVKRVIDMHGGLVHARWTQDAGSTISFSLPPVDAST